MTHGDARDRRTPAKGVPVEIDPEVTPPPQMMPASSPDAQDRLDALEQNLDRAIQSIGRVWDSRNDGDRLDGIEQRLLTSTQNNAELGALLREFVMPALKASMARIDLLLQHYEGNKVRQELFYDKDWPAFVKAFDSLGDRLGRLERTVHDGQNDMRGLSERFAVSQGAIVSRLSSVEAVGNSHDVRITALERVNEDAKTVSSALAKTERKKTQGGAAIIATIITAIGAAIQYLK